MNAMKSYAALAKRELWEHRALWIVPLVIAALGILITVYGSGALIYAHVNGYVNINTDVNTAPALRASLIGAAVPFNIALVLLVWFYLMDALYADRRDRSVLFWRSMPVSDTATVLAKLFTGIITAPAVMLVVVIMLEMVMGILFIIANAFIGVNFLAMIFHPGTIVLAWLTLAFALIVQSLWLLPFYGWLLLCSAWAKKLPLAWVVLIPVGAMLLESIVLHTHHLWNIVSGHITHWFGMLTGSQGHEARMFSGQAFHRGGGIMTFDSITRSLAQPDLWIGIGIAAVFVAGAIWLRRNRSEL